MLPQLLPPVLSSFTDQVVPMPPAPPLVLTLPPSLHPSIRPCPTPRQPSTPPPSPPSPLLPPTHPPHPQHNTTTNDASTQAIPNAPRTLCVGQRVLALRCAGCSSPLLWLRGVVQYRQGGARKLCSPFQPYLRRTFQALRRHRRAGVDTHTAAAMCMGLSSAVIALARRASGFWLAIVSSMALLYYSIQLPSFAHTGAERYAATGSVTQGHRHRV